MTPATLSTIFLAFVLSLPTATLGAPIRFRSAIPTALDKLPETIAVGDLNGDGHADVVATHYLEASVTVLLGTGQSSFIPAAELATRVGGIRAYIEDLDNDTKPDLIVSYDESDHVTVSRGNGDGTFAETQALEPGHDPVGVAIADLDGDGLPDLTVALSDEAGGQISVMRNLGNMQFERIQFFPFGTDAVDVVVSDFNGDGLPDAAVCNPEEVGLALLRGVAGGMFEPAGEVEVGLGTTLLVLADVDSDGSADVIAGRTDESRVSVLRSRGDGTFDAVVDYFSGGRALNGVVAADLNGDGAPDVVTSHLRSKSAGVLLGRGDGTFAPATAFTSGANPVEVGVADFNSDGLADVVSANEGVDSAAPSITLLLGNGAGRFAAPEQLLTTAAPVGVAVGDFNGDAVADAVVGSESQRGIVILPGAQGELSASSIVVPLDREPLQVLATDIDDDGWTDVVTLNGDDVSVLFADGMGQLSAAVHLPLPSAGRSFTAGDVDGDGDPDVIVGAARDPLAFYLIRSEANRVFAEVVTIATAVQASVMTAADLDGDGRSNLVTNDSQNRLFLFAAPDLQSVGNLLLQGIAAGIAAGDIDGNAAADVVAVSPTSGRLSTFLNDGTGVLAPSGPQSAGFASAVALRDLDGDGRGDAVVADLLTGETTAFQNEGAGAWRPREPVVAGERLEALSTGDFDGDGRYDLIATGASVCRLINETEEIDVVRGDGNGDGRVTAADFVALASELFDGDGIQVEGVALGTFAAKAGVDGDGDGVVTRADLRAVLLRLL